MIVLGTLGFSPDHFLPSVIEREDVDRVVVFYDAHPESIAARHDVARVCNERDIRFEANEVDAVDMIACATKIARRIRRITSTNLVFNITGGTRVLSAAATLACILEGAAAVYVDERTGSEHALPLIQNRYENLLSARQKKVLAFISRHPDCTQRDVFESLGLSKPTVNQHVTNLIRYRVVQVQSDPHDGRLKRLRVAPAARLLVERTEPKRRGDDSRYHDT